jgi:hypothetical protein
MRRVCLTVFASAWAGLAGAADFFSDPKAMCAFLAGAGMKAQLEWSQPQAGGPYFCKYAEQFSGRTAVVRGGSAAVDPKTGEVTLSVVIQALGDLTRFEATDQLKSFVAEFYRAQGLSVPEALTAIIGAKTVEKRTLPTYTVENTEPDLWSQQRALGLSFTSKASAETKAAAARGPSAQEKAATVTVKKALGERCKAAIAQSGQPAAPSLRESATQLSASRYLFEYADDAGGTFSCQVCDEADRKVNCGTLGLMLTYAPKGGQAQRLPAELDRKCVFYLQHEMMADDSGVFIDHALVERIRVSSTHTDSRWVYKLELDGHEYRCVIRKSDWSFRLEARAGQEWRGMTAGIMF